jgi:hypothetical protein
MYIIIYYYIYIMYVLFTMNVVLITDKEEAKRLAPVSLSYQVLALVPYDLCTFHSERVSCFLEDMRICHSEVERTISAILTANSMTDFNSLESKDLSTSSSKSSSSRAGPCPLLRRLVFAGLGLIVERARLIGRGGRDRLQRANTRWRNEV